MRFGRIFKADLLSSADLESLKELYSIYHTGVGKETFPNQGLYQPELARAVLSRGLGKLIPSPVWSIFTVISEFLYYQQNGNAYYLELSHFERAASPNLPLSSIIQSFYRD